MTAVWRDGNECQRSSDSKGLNWSLASPESGRARPAPYLSAVAATKARAPASTAARPVSESCGRDSSNANTPESPIAAIGRASPIFTRLFIQSLSLCSSARRNKVSSNATAPSTNPAPSTVLRSQSTSPEARRAPRQSSARKSGQRRSAPSSGRS